MAVVIKVTETVREEFKEVGNSGVFIADAKANYKRSMNLLRQHGLRALTFQEAFEKMSQNPVLMERLGGECFYLKGKGYDRPDIFRHYDDVLDEQTYYTFNEKGELTQGKGNIENTVHIFYCNDGWNPQLLSVEKVGSDYDRKTRYDFCTGGLWLPDGFHYRFELSSESAQDIARVVVGVPIDNKVPAPRTKITQAKIPKAFIIPMSLVEFRELLKKAAEEISGSTEIMGKDNRELKALLEMFRAEE